MRNSATKALLILALTTVLVSATTAQESKSVLESSNLKARQVLEDGINASGGITQLRAINDITRQIQGLRTDEGQGLAPIVHRPDYSRSVKAEVTNHPKFVSVRDLRKQRISDSLEDKILGGQPIKFRTVLTPDSYFIVYDDIKAVRPIPSSAINSSRPSMLRRYPESLLLLAWNRPETLSWVGDYDYEGKKQRVISYADSDGALVNLFFDAESKLLTKVETLIDNPVLGDISSEVVYDDYRAVDKLMLPFRYIDKYGGVMLQDLRASSIVINTNPPDTLFQLPEGLAKFESLPPTPSVTKLGEDVYAIMGTYNSLAVVFNDYVLVLEAGFSNGYSSASIAKIKEIAPGKPIRYLVTTHFHYDHLSGVRSYIAEGATIVTTPSAKQVIESLVVKTPHIRRPDQLARNPRPATIETFSTKRVFEDGAHKVELYDISPNPHCAEMLVAYLPKEKILFEADMLDIEIPGNVRAGGDDTADLAEKIKKLGLDVEKIVPVHGRIGSIADLMQALERRSTEKRTARR
ncbi:MAG: MBL fold metallo-hydrolase [Blastocatellia bacterium]